MFPPLLRCVVGCQLDALHSGGRLVPDPRFGCFEDLYRIDKRAGVLIRLGQRRYPAWVVPLRAMLIAGARKRPSLAPEDVRTLPFPCHDSKCHDVEKTPRAAGLSESGRY